MHIEHLFGVALAAAEILYATAHAVVLRTPGHAPESPIWNVIMLREAVVVPSGILALTFFYDHTAAPGVAAACVVLAITSAAAMLRIAPLIRRSLLIPPPPPPTPPAPTPPTPTSFFAVRRDHRSVPMSVPPAPEAGEPPLSSVRLASTADPDGIEVSIPVWGDPALETRSTRAFDELRQQRRLTQVLWDVPAAVVTVSREGVIEGKVGGAIRSAGYPSELTGAKLPPDSEIGRMCAEVLRTLKRLPFEIQRNGRTFSVVASPWISPSGRVRGVVLVLLTTEDTAMTDEVGLAIHYVEPKHRLA